MNLAGQLVNLAIIYNLSPESTPKELKVWYTYALGQDQVELETDEDGYVKGFMDWVRLARVPKSMADAYNIYVNQNHNIKQPVLFVGNSITGSTDTFFRLRRRIIDKNKDAQVHCFHYRKRDRMVVLNKRR